MPVKSTAVDTFQVDYTCNECGKGVMRPTGVTLMSNPPQYPHECTHCSHRMVLRVQYPHINYTPKDHTS